MAIYNILVEYDADTGRVVKAHMSSSKYTKAMRALVGVDGENETLDLTCAMGSTPFTQGLPSDYVVKDEKLSYSPVAKVPTDDELALLQGQAIVEDVSRSTPASLAAFMAMPADQQQKLTFSIMKAIGALGA